MLFWCCSSFKPLWFTVYDYNFSDSEFDKRTMTWWNQIEKYTFGNSYDDAFNEMMCCSAEAHTDLEFQFECKLEHFIFKSIFNVITKKIRTKNVDGFDISYQAHESVISVFMFIWQRTKLLNEKKIFCPYLKFFSENVHLKQLERKIQISSEFLFHLFFSFIFEIFFSSWWCLEIFRALWLDDSINYRGRNIFRSIKAHFHRIYWSYIWNCAASEPINHSETKAHIDSTSHRESLS